MNKLRKIFGNFTAGVVWYLAMMLFFRARTLSWPTRFIKAGNSSPAGPSGNVFMARRDF